MTQGNGVTGRIESTISALGEGAMRMAIETGRQEVTEWRQRLQDSGERELIPVSDNLAALETELARNPLDGAVIGRLMLTLAGQTREVAAGDLVGGSEEPVADRLQSLAGLLEREGRSISDEGQV